MTKFFYWGTTIITAIIIMYICVSLSGCFFFAVNENFALGVGGQEKDAEGNVTKIESKSWIPSFPWGK